ncbi:NAD(P)-dependent oxidoreductase [Amycolatopsis thermoflava]
MTTQRRLGFIGLGRMGAPMARRLASVEDIHLTVHDRSTAASDQFVQSSTATRAADIASAVRDCTELFLCLPGPAAVSAVVEEIAAAGGSQLRTVLNLSTNGVESSVDAAATLTGIDFLDCPVSGGEAGAAAGTLTIIVSGPAAAEQSCSSLFDVLGTAVYLGEKPGAAQAVKAANNFLSLTALAMTAEAVEVVSAFDVPLETQLRIYNASSGANSATRVKYPEQVLTGRFDFGFPCASVVKDLKTFLYAAELVGRRSSLAERSAALWTAACEKGWATADCTRVGEYIRSTGNPETSSGEGDPT